MTRQIWSRVAEELDSLLEMAPGERRARLETLAGENPELVRLLCGALAADEARIPLLDEALSLDLPEPEDLPEPAAPGIAAGERIGPWKLLRQLGHGGMGQVWLAERDDGQYQLQVAIKLIDGVLDSDMLRDQLRRERQILADLDHPHIARLVDGGIRDSGTPWYAMEYVEGEPLNEFCRDDGAALDRRLRLLATVARAVHHAHTRLVVHRDLKPNNILVDADGVPRLLDFGIAKLLAAGGDAPAGAVTLLGASTPQYAAPEQLEGRPVGTAADIYALGVIAWELIAGAPPAHAEREVDGSSRGPLPSRALGGRKARAAVRGDIDAIVSQALAPDPAARYASAEALADDIERYLSGQPVLARGAGAGYRAAKFARRHWLGVGLGSAAVAALCVALAVSIVHMRRAEQALERASAVQEFLLGVFEAAQPAPGDSGIMTQRELAERATRQLDQVLALQPETRIDVLIAVGRVFRKLGFPARSQTLLANALEALDASGASGDDPRRVEALYELGRADYFADEFDAAVEHLSHADRLAVRIGAPAARRAAILFELGSSYSALQQIDTALATLDEAGRVARDAPDAAELMPLIRLLTALTFRRAGQLDAAMDAGREAVESSRRHLGDDHVRTAGALSTVGAIFRRAGRLEVAESMLREALEIERLAYGQPQPATVNNLASILRDRGRMDESGRLFRQALELAGARHGPESASTASYRRNLALQQELAGELEQAATNLRHAYSRYAEQYGIDTLYNLNMRSQLAWVLARAGQHAGAGALLPGIFDNARPHDAAVVVRAHMVAAMLALERGEPETARGHIEEAESRRGPSDLETADYVRLQLLAGDVACAMGNGADARERWQRAGGTARERLGPPHPLAAAAAQRTADCPRR